MFVQHLQFFLQNTSDDAILSSEVVIDIDFGGIGSSKKFYEPRKDFRIEQVVFDFTANQFL